MRAFPVQNNNSSSQKGLSLSRREIPFFNYSALFTSQEEEIMGVIRDVLGRGAYILQRDLADFETSLRDFLGVKYAFGVADGTNALILSLRAMGVGPGDEVIVPSHTYVASAAAIHYTGAVPKLADCGVDHLIDPESARKAVTPQTKAIMPVQLNGRTADMDAILEIADEHDLSIVEDSAQALGSKFDGQFAGTFGKAGIFSFYPAKLLGCFGDGGAVVTNDDRVGEQIALLRDHGRNRQGEVVCWGTNCRLDNLHAAVLNYKFRTFTDEIKRRRQIAKSYQQGLQDVAEISLPPAPDADSKHFDVYQNYEIEAECRDELKQHLEDNGIHAIIQFNGKALHQLEGLGLTNVNLPATSNLYKNALLLPMNTALTGRDVEYIIGCTRSFYGRGADVD